MTYNQYTKNKQEIQRDTTEVFGTVPATRVSQMQWTDIRYDASDSQPNYIGLASTDLSTSDDGWVIFKFTYSGSNVTRIQKTKGVWDNRTSLF